ncbi:transcription factor TCP18-like [Raphanus sativus]|uniref:Transcription factor TCP18-like n=1 Tax=Raphanus sativus TaxID=3726 RepID=A0A9W3DSC2_RAPSA|nr:transcription factor TCP18-like [Raphanus sativus]
MNNNRSFSTTTTISEDYMLFPYNDHYSSQPLLPFSPCSSINDILIHSNSNPNILSHHLDHRYQFLQAPSSFSQFEFVPDFALLPYLHQQNNGHNDNKTTSDHHHPSLLPLNNSIGESLAEPSETITTHIEDSQRNSTFQDPKMNKVKKPSRTDRHSKIKTAKGTRDRRMRLSLDVAKELFGLQDMLGFDKASKTVEWLLTQAKPEIIKITSSLSNQFKHGGPAIGSMHTSSDLCKIGSMWTVEDGGSNTNSTETRENKVDGRLMRGKRKMLQPRTPILKKLSKDARERARERAKDRTKEKMLKRISQVNILDEEAHNHHDEIAKDNKSHVNCKSFEVAPCEEEIEQLLCKNDDFAVCNEFVANKFSSSFPMPNHHRSKETASSLDQIERRRFYD